MRRQWLPVREAVQASGEDIGGVWLLGWGGVNRQEVAACPVAANPVWRSGTLLFTTCRLPHHPHLHHDRVVEEVAGGYCGLVRGAVGGGRGQA